MESLKPTMLEENDESDLSFSSEDEMDEFKSEEMILMTWDLFDLPLRSRSEDEMDDFCAQSEDSGDFSDSDDSISSDRSKDDIINFRPSSFRIQCSESDASAIIITFKKRIKHMKKGHFSFRQRHDAAKRN